MMSENSFYVKLLKKDYYKSNKKRGFTLIEVLTVIAIIAILAAIAVPSYNNFIKKARIAKAVSEVKILEQEIISYNLDRGNFPDSLDDIGRGSLRDPWNNPYQYTKIEGGSASGKGKLRRDRFLNPLNTDFDLYSMGEDGASQTNLNANDSQDDIVRATNGGYIGLATSF